jgi:rhodanese-related sulfurtransferase
MTQWWISRRAWWAVLVGLLTLGTGGVTDPAAGAGPETATTRRVQVGGGAAYTDVNAAGLAAMLRAKTFPLINVHVPYEGEIEETDLFIPFDKMEANLAKLPSDRGARIVLYCRTGPMSTTAARELAKRGYTDVWNLDGGMVAWERAGYPLRRAPR